jgi:hypothetical protein
MATMFLKTKVKYEGMDMEESFPKGAERPRKASSRSEVCHYLFPLLSANIESFSLGIPLAII